MRLISSCSLSLDSNYYTIYIKQSKISKEAVEVSGICHMIAQRHLR